MYIGERIKKARERRGWNQRELAKQAQVNHAWISRLESGERHNISLEAASRLAVTLGVTLDYLAGITMTNRPQTEPYGLRNDPRRAPVAPGGEG